MKCHWWNRWYHRRLRRIDTETVYATMVKETNTLDQRNRAWNLFISLPGQEHWQCECSERDRDDHI
jgi:hypothetical protein